MAEALTELNIGGEEARITKQKIERVWITFIKTQKQRIANEKLQEELQNAEQEIETVGIDKQTQAKTLKWRKSTRRRNPALLPFEKRCKMKTPLRNKKRF